MTIKPTLVHADEFALRVDLDRALGYLKSIAGKLDAFQAEKPALIAEKIRKLRKVLDHIEYLLDEKHF